VAPLRPLHPARRQDQYPQWAQRWLGWVIWFAGTFPVDTADARSGLVRRSFRSSCSLSVTGSRLSLSSMASAAAIGIGPKGQRDLSGDPATSAAPGAARRRGQTTTPPSVTVASRWEFASQWGRCSLVTPPFLVRKPGKGDMAATWGLFGARFRKRCKSYVAAGGLTSPDPVTAPNGHAPPGSPPPLTPVRKPGQAAKR
jgi:hypothetical protein